MRAQALLLLGLLGSGCLEPERVVRAPQAPAPQQPQAAPEQDAKTRGGAEPAHAGEAMPVSEAGPTAPPTVSPTEPAKEEMLYGPSLGTAEPLYKMTKQERAALLSWLYPRALADSRLCPVDPPGSLNDAQARNLFAPTLTAKRTGAFTRPGVVQDLYLISLGECGAAQADNYGTHLLYVVENGKVVLQVTAQVLGLGATIDADLDGTLDVITTTGTTAMGELYEFATLVSLAGGQLNTLKDFGQVLHSTCASSPPDGESVTTVWVTPGTPPRYRVEQEQRTCE